MVNDGTVVLENHSPILGSSSSLMDKDVCVVGMWPTGNTEGMPGNTVG